VKPAKRSDVRHLAAAMESFAAGHHAEALRELQRMSLAGRADIDVMDLSCHVLAGLERWEECLELGEALVKAEPKAPHGWTNRSAALYRLNRAQEAFDSLRLAAELFPDEWGIRYELACYCCTLGRLEETLDWLEEAFELGDAKTVKLMALDDPDLEPIWAKIRMK
jgi:tetratricopeptide (TPR) repeat protein